MPAEGEEAENITTASDNLFGKEHWMQLIFFKCKKQFGGTNFLKIFNCFDHINIAVDITWFLPPLSSLYLIVDVLHQKTLVTKTKGVIHILRLAAPSVVFAGKLKSGNYCWK